MLTKTALNIVSARFKKSGLKEPFFEAELLLSAVLKKPRSFILTHPEFQLPPKAIALLARLSAKRAAGWPFSYLTGHREFFGRDFLVNKNVLIPRPETELLVEEVMAAIRILPGKKTIIDVGTGSGCIIITLAKSYKGADYFGVDISPAALKTARQNARRLGAKNLKFFRSDLLKKFCRKQFTGPLIIAANLPYLTPAQIKAEPSIKHEPKLALAAGADGLKYYRQLFRQIKTIKAPALTLVCEIDPRQRTAFVKLVKSSLPSFSYEIKNDLAGLDRLVIIKKI